MADSVSDAPPVTGLLVKEPRLHVAGVETARAVGSRVQHTRVITGPSGWSPISGPPGIRARLLLIWILVDVAGYGVMGVAALGSVFGRSAITQR